MGRRWELDIFFQAEDGRRDLTVTGVQTCALPIYAVELEPNRTWGGTGERGGGGDPGDSARVAACGGCDQSVQRNVAVELTDRVSCSSRLCRLLHEVQGSLPLKRSEELVDHLATAFLTVGVFFLDLRQFDLVLRALGDLFGDRLLFLRWHGLYFFFSQPHLLQNAVAQALLRRFAHVVLEVAHGGAVRDPGFNIGRQLERLDRLQLHAGFGERFIHVVADFARRSEEYTSEL